MSLLPFLHRRRVAGFDPNILFTINTALSDATASPAEDFVFPLAVGQAIEAEIDWGDGNKEVFSGNVAVPITHNYATGGEYDIQVKGTMDGFAFTNAGDKAKITEIKSWGAFEIGANAFCGCANLTTISASDAPAVGDYFKWCF